MAGHALDVDKLLWVPGAKTFFIPTEIKRLTSAEIIAAELERIQPRLRMLFERDDRFYSMLTKQDRLDIISGRPMRIPFRHEDET